MQKEFSLPKGALVLASQSSTRRKMLADAGIHFIVRAAHVDEEGLRASATASLMPAADIAVLLAEMKARKVAHDNDDHPSGFVLGADQILVCDDQILGKPKTHEMAASHLQLLSGKTHQLLTAAVIYRDGERIWHHIEAPTLTMWPLTDEFIDHYLQAIGDAALATPGSYQIEGWGAHLFSSITGCSYAVLGLPILQVLAFLRGHGLALRGQE